MDFLIPGLIGITIMDIGLARGGADIVRLRQKGILQHFWSTRVRPAVFAAAWGLAHSLALLLRVIVVVLLAAAVFMERIE